MTCAIGATETGAVTAAARHKPDLMSVDAHLGHGSGLAAVDTIIREDPVLNRPGFAGGSNF